MSVTTEIISKRGIRNERQITMFQSWNIFVRASQFGKFFESLFFWRNVTVQTMTLYKKKFKYTRPSGIIRNSNKPSFEFSEKLDSNWFLSPELARISLNEIRRDTFQHYFSFEKGVRERGHGSILNTKSLSRLSSSFSEFGSLVYATLVKGHSCASGKFFHRVCSFHRRCSRAYTTCLRNTLCNLQIKTRREKDANYSLKGALSLCTFFLVFLLFCILF